MDDDRTVAQPAAARGEDSALSPNALPVGTRLHEFEIVGLVGEGGFGIVYLARDCVLERKVALKEYLPAALASRGPGATVAPTSSRSKETFEIGLRSFINEARMLAQFDHPALVKVYRFWEANGTAYMVMPYYEGITLKEELTRADAPADEARLRALLAQLLDALEVLHRANALHRDIAPDNILILPDGNPLLLDFGAARRVITDRTQELTAILKPGYAPIEQYAESPALKQGPWTDLYALAAVAHFAITGERPAPAVTRSITDPVVPLSQAAAGRYSEELLRALDQALSVKPESRPQSVAAFRSLLGLQNAQRTVTLTATPAAGRPAAGRDWLRLGVYGGIAAMLAAAIGAAIVLNGDRPAPPAPAAQNRPEPVAAVVKLPEPEVKLPEPEAKPPEPKAKPPEPKAKLPEPKAKPAVAAIVAPPVVKEPPKPPAPPRPAKAPAAEEAPGADTRLASLVATFMQNGEKCFKAKQYDCAITNANAALQIDPASASAQKLKTTAAEEQQRALKQIRIE